MIPFVQMLKRNFVEHGEKILLALLILVFIASVFRSVTTLFHEFSAASPALNLYPQSRGPDAAIPFPQEEYDTLIQSLRTPVDLNKLDRDIFVHKAQEGRTALKQEAEKTDTDNDGMPNEWEVRYNLDPTDPSDAQMDLDRDSYTNLDEYIGGSDPADPNSFPGVVKLKVLDIYRRGIEVRFFGYIELPDGSHQIQMNWGGKTAFVKTGEAIHGYEIVNFVQESSKRFNPRIGDHETIDVSHVMIKKADNPPMKLVIGRPSFEKELYARIQDAISGKIYSVHAGSKIKSYKVLDIKTDKVIIKRNKKTYTLGFEGKR